MCALAQGADRPAAKQSQGVAPDLEFLEYLGTLESDEENWTDVVNIEFPAPDNSVDPSTKPAVSKPKAAMRKTQVNRQQLGKDAVSTEQAENPKPKAETAVKDAGSEK